MPRKKRKGPKPGTLFKDVQRTAVGLNIAAARRRRGITQSQLAEKACLDKTTISYYERKCQSIPFDKLHRLAEALNVSTDFLLNGDATRADMSASKAFLTRLEKAKAMPQEKQKLIMDLIDNLFDK
jgi:transcriptional regulator with XRE-family HTH domain